MERGTKFESRVALLEDRMAALEADQRFVRTAAERATEDMEQVWALLGFIGSQLKRSAMDFARRPLGTP